VYSVGGADVAEVVEDAVAGTVEFEEEDVVGGELPYNSKAPIPAARATAPAPAYFRKRRLEVFRLDLLDSTKALNSSLQRRLPTIIFVVSPTFRDFGSIEHTQNIGQVTSRRATVFFPAFPPRLRRLRMTSASLNCCTIIPTDVSLFACGCRSAANSGGR